MVSFGQLLEQVVAVTLRLHVDGALRPLECVEVLPGSLFVRVRLQEEADHERGIDDLSEPLLLHHVHGRAKDVARGNLAFQQPRQTVQRTAGELQLDAGRLQDVLQCL